MSKITLNLSTIEFMNILTSLNHQIIEKENTVRTMKDKSEIKEVSDWDHVYVKNIENEVTILKELYNKLLKFRG